MTDRGPSGFDDCFDGDPFPNDDDPTEAEHEGPIDHAAINRGAKAEKMTVTAEALFIEAGLDPYVDAEQISRELREFTDAQWLDLQTAAGFQLRLPAHRRKTPSKRTQDMVIDRFEQRATAAAHLEDE